jgi:hypothetical protein
LSCVLFLSFIPNHILLSSISIPVYEWIHNVQVKMTVVGVIPPGLPTPKAIPFGWRFFVDNALSAGIIAVIGYIGAIYMFIHNTLKYMNIYMQSSPSTFQISFIWA